MPPNEHENIFGEQPIFTVPYKPINKLVRIRSAQSISRITGKFRLTIRLLLALGCIAANASNAATLMGEVIEITDGDTITLIDSSRIQHKIRLAGIDAPEKRQAFGEKSKQQLADLVFRREVLIEWSKSDRYGRIIGKVFLGNKDVNLTQITSGMAWHYKRYANEQSMTDRGSYAQAEEEAKLKRRGLWKDQNPTPPWDFRHHR